MRHVAFVRAVMVGREGLDRTVLTGIFESAGAATVRSHLATGNVSFHTPAGRLPAIVEHVEREIGDVVGRRTEVFVRTQADLERLIDADPFAVQPYPAPRDRVVLFFTSQVPRTFVVPVEYGESSTAFAKTRREVLIVTRDRADGRHPGNPMGLIERQTGQRTTARAWSTVLRVARPD
jgi:uncharacterized protein (DUF1697 family)